MTPLSEEEEFEFRYRLEQEQAQVQPEPSFGDTTMSALRSLSPASIAPNLTPENLSPYLPVAGAVAGGMFGPAVAAIGAGGGQILSRMADVGYGRVPASDAMDPKTEAIGPMVQSAAAGIPDVSGVLSAGKRTLGEAVVRGFAKTGQTLSGVKQDVLEQAHRQGVKTYLAPSVSKAQENFGKALGPEGQAAMKTPLDDVFDPALGNARSLAKEAAEKMAKGETLTATEALKARQATDRIISATSQKDKMARNALFDIRKKFDEVMTSQSGSLKKASTDYRKALVKSHILSPTRLNKGGEPSAFLPLVLGAGGRGLAGVASTLTGTSPMMWGLGATVTGSVSPTARRALVAEFVDRITMKRQSP